MDWVIEALRFAHIGAGTVGLLVYWIPVFSRKGGKAHRRYGRIFAWAAYVVLSAAAAAISVRFVGAALEGIGPRDQPASFAFLVFLGYLTVVTFIVLRHGLRVLRFKKSVAAMAGPADRFLAWLSLGSSAALVAYALYFRPPNMIVLLALSPVGALTGKGLLEAFSGRRTARNAWLLEHLGAMLGAGIAFHTAFAVFGMTRLFDTGISGPLAALPWILPTLIGIPATHLWTKKYERGPEPSPAA